MLAGEPPPPKFPIVMFSEAFPVAAAFVKVFATPDEVPLLYKNNRLAAVAFALSMTAENTKNELAAVTKSLLVMTLDVGCPFTPRLTLKLILLFRDTLERSSKKTPIPVDDVELFVLFSRYRIASGLLVASGFHATNMVAPVALCR